MKIRLALSVLAVLIPVSAGAVTPVSPLTGWDPGNALYILNKLLIAPINRALSSFGVETPITPTSAYGGDVQIYDTSRGNNVCSVTTSGASLTVTSGSCSFVAADAGKLIVVNNAGATATTPYSGTIATVVGANQITVSPAFGQSLVATAEPMRWGHDEGAAINNCILASQALGLKCTLPPAKAHAWGTSVPIELRPNNGPASLVGAGSFQSYVALMAPAAYLAHTGSQGAKKGGLIEGVTFDAGKLAADTAYFSCLSYGVMRDVQFLNASTDQNMLFGDATGVANGCGDEYVYDLQMWNNPTYYPSGDYPPTNTVISLPDNRFFNTVCREASSRGIDIENGDNDFFGVHCFSPNQADAETAVYFGGNGNLYDLKIDHGIGIGADIEHDNVQIYGGRWQGDATGVTAGINVTNHNRVVITGFDATNITDPTKRIVLSITTGVSNCIYSNPGASVSFTQQCNSAQTSPYLLAGSGIPFVLPSSGSMANNGALTTNAAITAAYSASYVYLPANAIAAGSAAGWYWGVWSDTQNATIYNNTYTSGVPVIQSSPTPFVTTGPGLYAQTTGATLPGPTFTLPANSMGINGALQISATLTMVNDGNNKIATTTFGGSTVYGGTYTTSTTNSNFTTVMNRGRTDRQISGGEGNQSSGLGSSTKGINTTSIDTTADQAVAFGVQIANVADFLILQSYKVTVQPSVP